MTTPQTMPARNHNGPPPVYCGTPPGANDFIKATRIDQGQRVYRKFPVQIPTSTGTKAAKASAYAAANRWRRWQE